MELGLFSSKHMVHRKIIFQYLIKDREKKNQKQKSYEKSIKLSKIQNFGSIKVLQREKKQKETKKRTKRSKTHQS